MANLASAKKRNKQNERNRCRNRARRSLIKTETRKLLDAIHAGTLHRNAAARKKSRLAQKLNAALAAAETG